MREEGILRIALQKSGRLSEKSLELLKACGISLSSQGGSRRLKARAVNFPLEVLFLRDDDIPQYVSEGVADVGILGENVVKEKGYALQTVKKLGFARCRLSLAIPRDAEYNNLRWFEGKKIATTYPNILREFLAAQAVSAQLEEIAGSVEIAPGIGLADGICDLVSTGSTLLSNGLKEVETVMQSEAVLVATEELAAGPKKLLSQLLFRLEAVMAAKRSKYILLNAPNEAVAEISRILPGIKSPTVLPLAEEGWSSLHSVVQEDDFWEVIDQLREAGAEGILVAPIEKIIR